MRKLVHKYPLNSILGSDHVTMRKGWSIIHVGVQHDTPTLWIEEPVLGEWESVTFILIGTGQEVPEDAMHIGTILLDDGYLVVHIYKQNS